MQIIKDKKIQNNEDGGELQAFSNLSANLLDEWRDDSKDAVWR